MKALTMRARFEYFRPATLHEALCFLAAYGSETAVLAGGTDLMIAIRAGEVSSKFVMDVSRLDELRAVEKRNRVVSIGAALTHTEIAHHALVKEFTPVLGRAAGYVGSVQIRNVGTLGGNAANASPAADSIPPLIVHNARAIIRSASTERVEPIQDLIVGPYRTNLNSDELITAFVLESLGEGYRHAFHRIARRQALAVARINVAAVGRTDESGRVEDLRVSVGSITPRPSRMTAAEEHLRGRTAGEKLIREAAEKVSTEMLRQSGVRASTEYKEPAVRGLVFKALSELFL
jgi:CO/xanthine dehydrogenase FAD-binding subunit